LDPWREDLLAAVTQRSARADPPRKKSDTTKEMQTWTKAHLRVFLDAMKDERLSSPLWHTIAMTGMRRGHRPALE